MHRAILFFLAFVIPALGQDVRISEFMPVNTAGLQDEDLTPQPWIELWNTDPLARVILTNWRLSHNGTLWTFPAGTEIAPNGYLVVFADGKNRTTVTNPLHTNFSLSSTGGGPLQLIRSTGAVASSYTTYPAVPANVSYGQDPAEPAQVGIYTTPTPEDPNNYSGSGVSGKVLFSETSRSFTGSLSVTLSEATPTAGAVIRYTTNGTVPTSASTEYTGTPISITATTLLRARVFAPGKLPGETDVAGYLLVDGSTTNFQSTMPIVVMSNLNTPLSFTADPATDFLTTNVSDTGFAK